MSLVNTDMSYGSGCIHGRQCMVPYPGCYGTPLPATQPEHKMDKGLKNGTCNRTACQKPRATWYNDSTRAYYCAECAAAINRGSRIDIGRDICKEETDHE